FCGACGNNRTNRGGFQFAAARLPWFRDQVAAGRQQLKCGDVLPHDMVESSAAAWRDEMSMKVAGK
ncbi:hypothetical protein LGN84_25205, partial [Escherichia coli]|nr:hypothetical protein [Escherichia coli]